VIKKPQKRRPRPDLGCRAIGWKELLGKCHLEDIEDVG
jgi:hypothetical protein